MVKNWSSICMSLVLAFICNCLQAQEITYHITGKVGRYSAPAKAYLMHMNGGDRQLDSAIIDKGTFAFTGRSDQPEPATLVINTRGTGFMAYDAGLINIFLEAGNISVNSSDSLQKAAITGGPLNEDYAVLKSAFKKTDAKLDSVNNIFFTAPPEKQKSTQFRDSIVKESFQIQDEKKLVALDFLKDHPSSIVSLSALEDYAGLYPDPRLLAPAFDLLSANIRLSKAGLSYAAKIALMKRSAIGAVAPDFTLADTLGKPVSLHDFKSKYVLIDFWASWCGPCRAENPNLVKVYKLYKQKNFVILGVSSDVAKAKQQWLNAIQEDHLPWVQVADLNKGSKNEAVIIYDVNNIPQNVLVAPDGKIIDKNLRGDDLTDRLQKLFGQ